MGQLLTSSHVRESGSLCISIGLGLVIVSKCWIPFGNLAPTEYRTQSPEAVTKLHNLDRKCLRFNCQCCSITNKHTSTTFFFFHRSWLEWSTLILQRGAPAVIKFMNSR